MDEMLLGGGTMTEDDWEGKGFSFADVKGVWDQYRVSGTGAMLSSQGGYTEDVLRTKITQGGLTPSELNAYMRGLNQRGNNLTILLPSEIVAFYNGNNSSCYAVLYVENEVSAPSSSSLQTPSSSSKAIVPTETQYAAEIGTVCVGFANSLPTQPIDDTYMVSNGTNAYLNMYQMCGDRAEYQVKGNSTQVTSWLNQFNISTVIFNSINQELFVKGNSAYLGFYAARDGYLRYLYVELVGDGKGLLKISAIEKK
jgi:hypothetical protein